MTQPAPQIPGLITAQGHASPAILPPSAIPGNYPDPAPAPPAHADPIPVTGAVQAAPAVADPGAPGYTMAQQQLPPALQLPTQLQAPAAVLPATSIGTVPGLNPPPTPAGLLPPNVASAPAPVPAAPAAPAPPATGEQDRGYPQGTPLEQMDAGQREAYWKFHARQWETRAKERNDYDALKEKASQLDQLVASQATDQEKAITAARAEGERAATARAAVVLVDAHVRAGLQQRLQPHQVEALAGNLNHQHFLGADGLSVDAAKVAQFVDTVAPPQQPAAMAPAAPAVPGGLPVGIPTSAAATGQPVTGLPRALPDLGQGSQTQAPLDKLEAGRQQARAFLSNGGFR